jgi:hypothetical protein
MINFARISAQCQVWRLLNWEMRSQEFLEPDGVESLLSAADVST